MKKKLRATVPDMPLYRAIYAQLAKEIAEGAYPVGQKLPSEQELCQRFSASRYTIRDALRQLQDEGIIRRRRGSGSIVASRLAPKRFVSSVHSVDSLMQYVAETRLEILTTEKIVVDHEFARMLGCPDDSVWLRISALRRSGDEALPFAYTEIYIAESYGGVAADVGAYSVPVYRSIEEAYGLSIARVDQTIEAATADRNLASRLTTDLASPILRITRRYISSDGELVEVAINCHPANRFQYNTLFEQRGLATDR
jgi:DNA-binding GntR family transcriptional regulator